jgi:hypothetical protein
MPDGTPQDIDAVAEVTTLGCRVGPSHPLRPAPCTQDGLGCDGFRWRGTDDRESISRPHPRLGPTEHAFGRRGSPESLLPAVERDSQPEGAEHPPLGDTGFGGRPPLICPITGVEPRFAPRPSWDVAHGRHPGGVPAVIEGACDSGLEDPWPRGVGPGPAQDVFARVVPSSARAQPGADPVEPRFPAWCQGGFHPGWPTSLADGGTAARSGALARGDVDATARVHPMPIEGAELTAERPSCFRGRPHDVIEAGCRLPMVHLGASAPTRQSVRPTLQHPSRQRPDVLQSAIA